MSKKNILLAITNGIWLIDAQTAEQLGPHVASVLAGEKFWNDKHKASHEILIVEPNNSYFSNSSNSAKAGSIAIINISGPIMKYDNCGDPGSQTYEGLIQQAASNPNIIGIILTIDSGGGTVAGTQSLATVIKSIDKPTVTLAEDLMCSAAYWIGSSSDYILANSDTARIGSIGTMISFSDMQPVWEAMGAKFHEVYATASTAKNADIADARKGNYENLIKNTLDPLNNVFMNSVKANRGDKLNTDKTLNGQVYTASDALKYGLIDGIGNLQDAIAKINELASGETTPTQTHKTENQINMKKITLMASHAALIALCGASISAGETSVDVELTDELLTSLNAKLTDAETTAIALVTANEKITAAEKKATDAEAKVTVTADALKLAEAKIITLENPGSTITTSTSTVENTGDDGKVSYRTVADDALAKAKAAIPTEFV